MLKPAGERRPANTLVGTMPRLRALRNGVLALTPYHLPPCSCVGHAASDALQHLTPLPPLRDIDRPIDMIKALSRRT